MSTNGRPTTQGAEWLNVPDSLQAALEGWLEQDYDGRSIEVNIGVNSTEWDEDDKFVGLWLGFAVDLHANTYGGDEHSWTSATYTAEGDTLEDAVRAALALTNPDSGVGV